MYNRLKKTVKEKASSSRWPSSKKFHVELESVFRIILLIASHDRLYSY